MALGRLAPKIFSSLIALTFAFYANCDDLYGVTKTAPSSAGSDFLESEIDTNISGNASQTAVYKFNSINKIAVLNSLSRRITARQISPENIKEFKKCTTNGPLNIEEQLRLANKTASDPGAEKISEISSARIINCGGRTASHSKTINELFNSKDNSKFFGCAEKYPEFFDGVRSAHHKIVESSSAVMSCEDIEDSIGDQSIMKIGHDIQDGDPKEEIDPIFKGLLMQGTVGSEAASEITLCCGSMSVSVQIENRQEAQKSCNFLRFTARLKPIESFGVRKLLKLGFNSGVPQNRLTEFSEKASALVGLDSSKYETAAGQILAEASLLKLCIAELQPELDCTKSYKNEAHSVSYLGTSKEFTSVSVSKRVSSADIASISAERASPGTPMATLAKAVDGVASVGSALKVRGNSESATDSDVRRFASTGPVTRGLAQMTHSLVNQVLPEAYASSTNNYEFHQAGTASVDGVPILESSLNGKKTYIAASVPFSADGKLGEPTIVSGASPKAVAQAYEAAIQKSNPAKQLSRTQTSASDAGEVGSGTGSGGNSSGVTGESSSTASSPGFTNQDRKATSSVTNRQSEPVTAQTYPSVSALNKALASAPNTVNFLRRAEPALTALRVQYSCSGSSYPLNPKYKVIGRYDCEEVKRWFKP
jgi:hypothetical protein